MKPYASLDFAAIGAGWRVLRRHLRYAGKSPRKLLWIARRAVEIVRGGHLFGVLQRHRLVEDFYVEYPRWVEREERDAARRVLQCAREAAEWRAHPTFSVLLPVYCPGLPVLEQAIESVRAQPYREWELRIVDDGSPQRAHVAWLEALAQRDARVHFVARATNAGIAAATNDALAAASGDFCVFLDQDDLLARCALFEFAAQLARTPSAALLYADEDRINERGDRSRPAFKPDWDPEWLRATNYVLHPVAIRTTLLRRLGGLSAGLDGVQDWDLLLRVAEAVDHDAIVHVPRILYHWREHAGSTAAAVYEKPGLVEAQERALRASIIRRDERAVAELTEGGWRLKHALPSPAPRASIVIPTRDALPLIRGCVESLQRRTEYPDWEAVIVDNDTRDHECLRFLRSLAADRRFTVLRDEREFNYAALCNKGVNAAGGEVVVLMNNDVTPIDGEWLRELVAQALRPSIGMVGAMLFYPDNTIQHAGVVLGLNGVADRPYIGYPSGFRGVDGRLGAVHCVESMVTACAALRRKTYAKVGGMDESLPVACNDLDLCLRVGALGLRNVMTPFAQLYHAESASRGYHYDTRHALQETRDEARFRLLHGERLRHDRFYNPNLTLRGPAYALAWSAEDRSVLQHPSSTPGDALGT